MYALIGSTITMLIPNAPAETNYVSANSVILGSQDLSFLHNSSNTPTITSAFDPPSISPIPRIQYKTEQEQWTMSRQLLQECRNIITVRQEMIALYEYFVPE